MAQADLLNIIINVLGILVKQREVLSDDGYDTISTIIHWNYDNTCEWFTTKYKLITTRGGDSYGDQKIKCLQALEWWATNLTLRGKKIVLADFDATMMAYCIDEENFDYKDRKKDPDTNKTDNLSHIKWLAWEEMVYTYSTAMKNIRGVPLTYVICKTPAPSGIVIYREQDIIKKSPLRGNMFSCDTKKVLKILNDITVDTDADTWMKGKCCV